MVFNSSLACMCIGLTCLIECFMSVLRALVSRQTPPLIACADRAVGVQSQSCKTLPKTTGFGADFWGDLSRPTFCFGLVSDDIDRFMHISVFIASSYRIAFASIDPSLLQQRGAH